PSVLVGGDALSLVELHADVLEPEPLDNRTAPDRYEHQIRLDGLAVAEMHRQLGAVVLDLRALLLEMQCDAALAELLRKLLRGVDVFLRNEVRQHLDDRHLAAEAVEDRRELAADDAAAEDNQTLRHRRLGEEPLRVDAAVGVEPVDRRPQRERARRDDRRLERHVLATL